MTYLKHGLLIAAVMLAAAMTSLRQADAAECEQEAFEERDMSSVLWTLTSRPQIVLEERRYGRPKAPPARSRISTRSRTAYSSSVRQPLRSCRPMNS